MTDYLAATMVMLGLTQSRYAELSAWDRLHADLGADYFLQRTGRARQARRLLSQLNMLGCQVSLQSAEPV